MMYSNRPRTLAYFIWHVPPELASEKLLCSDSEYLLDLDVLDVRGADDHRVHDRLQTLLVVAKAEVVDVVSERRIYRSH
jgi:hypothetical protein